MRRRRRLAPFLMLAALAACNHYQSTPTSSSGPVTLTGVVIYGAPTSSMGVGQTAHLRGMETYSNNKSVAISAGISWTSSSPSVATVSADGTVFAVAPGTTIITGRYVQFSSPVTIRVVQNWPDLDFRVVVLNGGSDGPLPSDVVRIVAKASDFLFERTGSRMRLIDMADAGPGTSIERASRYLDAWTGEQPDGIVVWSDDPDAVSFGGFSQTVARLQPFVNRFPGVSGNNRIYVSTIDYDHKYARCGYDTTGAIRISDKSANGECRNQSGLVCVDTGRYWQCPDSLSDFYAQPDVFQASTVVHEFMHPFGSAGNNDHYGTPTCIARVGMSATEAADLAKGQWNMGQCPDLFLHFRPTGAPSSASR